MTTTFGGHPAYREGDFEVVAYPHGFCAYRIDAEGKHLHLAGSTDKPPHWGIWQGTTHTSSYGEPVSLFVLMDLFRRAQEALGCKENRQHWISLQR